MGCDTSYFGCAPYNLAVSKGFFKQHGLNVTERHITSTVAGTAALESGSLDFSLGSDPLVVYSKSGTVLQQVAPTIKTYDLFLVIARPTVQPSGSTVGAELAALKGKKVGLAGGVGTTSYYAILGALSAHSLGTEGITWVNVPIGPGSLADLKSGAVDAVVTDPVSSVLSEKTTGLRTLTVFGNPGVLPSYLNQIISGMEVKQSYAKAHPTVVREFAAAMDEANAYIQQQSHLGELASAIDSILGNALSTTQSTAVAKVFLKDIFQPYISVSDLQSNLKADQQQKTLGSAHPLKSTTSFLSQFIAPGAPTSASAVTGG